MACTEPQRHNRIRFYVKDAKIEYFELSFFFIESDVPILRCILSGM